ncbi:MAG: hypothetical protein KatS3mg031_3046 [Chitinophagales bacterium]|nr:MAG: hypothetical protein KatS3mg031_3046 [Chitinophagales bacterium]
MVTCFRIKKLFDRIVILVVGIALGLSLQAQSVYHTREYVRYLDTANFAPALEVTVPGPGHIAVWVDYTKPFNMPDTFSFLMKAYLTMVDATGDTQLTMVYIPFTYINKGESPEVTFVRFGGVKRLEVTFDTVLYSLQDTTSIIPWADVPENILLEVMLSDGDCPGGAYVPLKRGLTVEHDLSTHMLKVKWTPLPCAEYYELEWIEVGNIGPSGQEIPAQSLRYYFPHRAMRVKVKGHVFEMPAVFYGGYYIFRYRGVWYDPETPGEYVYSEWSLDDNYDGEYRRGIKTVSQLPSATWNKPYVKISKSEGLETGKNRLFELVTDDEGHYKYVMRYYDGLGMERQVLEAVPSQGVVRVSGTLYDHLGRSSVQVLPGVDSVKGMHYRLLYWRDKNGEEYDARDFLQGLPTDGCPGGIVPDSMSILYGAARYYSSQNPFMESDGVADAGGYPFVLSIYRDDPSGGLMYVGMAGKEFQPGERGKKTIESGVLQSELDRLLGNHVGEASFYRKEMIKDENGGWMMQIKRIGDGKVVASGMVRGGENLLPLDSEWVVTRDTIWKTVGGAGVTGTVVSSGPYYHYAEGNFSSTGKTVEMTYRLETPDVNGPCNTGCYDCRYIARLKVSGTCSGVVADLQFEPGKDTLAGVCQSDDNAFWWQSTLSFGEENIGVYRELIPDSMVMEAYFQDWLKQQTCISYVPPVIDTTGGCDLPCDPGDTLCESEGEISICRMNYEVMLSHFHPGATYASYKRNGNTVSADDPLSVFYLQSKLKPGEAGLSYTPTKLVIHQPWIKTGGVWKPWYVNENGWRDTVWLGSDYNAAVQEVMDTLQLYWAGGKYFTYAENLRPYAWIDRFQPSWAKSLVVYHPEYVYYRECMEILHQKKIFVTVFNDWMNSETFDRKVEESLDTINASVLDNLYQYDPMFAGGVPVVHFWRPYDWQITDNDTSCSVYTLKTIFMQMLNNFYGSGMSITQVAHSLVNCDAPGNPVNWSDTGFREAYIMLYKIAKQSALKSYLDGKANEKREMNAAIGDPYVDPFKIWRPFPCGQSYGWNNAFMWWGQHPYLSYFQQPYHLSGQKRRGDYAGKEKVWHMLSQEEVLMQVESKHSSSYNGIILSTGLCPEAYELGAWLQQLHKAGQWVEQGRKWSLCTDPLYHFLGVLTSAYPQTDSMYASNLYWTNTGQHCWMFQVNSTVYPFMRLTVDSPGVAFNGTNVLSLQYMHDVTYDTVTGKSHFKMHLWIKDAGGQLKAVKVNGEIALKLTGCVLQPDCRLTEDAKALESLLWQHVKWTSGAVLNVPWPWTLEMPMSQMNYVYQNNQATFGSYKIMFNFGVVPDTMYYSGMKPLQDSIGGCTHEVWVLYHKPNGVLDSVKVTLWKQNKAVPLYCCYPASPCGNDLLAEERAKEMVVNLVNAVKNGSNTVDIPQGLHIGTLSGTVQMDTAIDGQAYRVYLPKRTDPECIVTITPPLPQNVMFALLVDSVWADGIPDASGNVNRFLVLVKYPCYLSGQQVSMPWCYDTLTVEGCFGVKPCNLPPYIDYPPVEIDSLGEWIDPCENAFQALYAQQLLADSLAWVDSLRRVFYDHYRNGCSQYDDWLVVKDSSRSLEYYTVYLYDNAGRLLETISPEGMDMLTPAQQQQAKAYRKGTTGMAVYPAYSKRRQYRYNSFSELVWQRTPDGGRSRFYYDGRRRLVASQNEEQAQHNRWSFTRYDFQNRPVMAGVTHQSTAPTPQQLNDTAWPYNWGNGPYRELVGTHWDALPPNAPPGWKPGLLRARIAAVWRDDDGDGEPEHRAWYDYDAPGNVKRYLQEVESLKEYGMHYRKQLEYAYDPLSGKVNEVVYQRGRADAMYHRYKYDEDLRLTEVWTSRDGQYWENDARYRYYLHGPLKRKETGKWHLQGEDYAYTINGWMKGLNAWKRDSTLDMGRDGLAGGPNEWYGVDVLGYEVKYFEGDYQGVGPGGFQRSDTLTVAGLYNGNIAGSSIDQWGQDHLQRRYRYDVLNRLQAFEGLDGSGNLKSDWNTSYRYDKDGNILRLMRMGPNGLMDSLTYHYQPGKDQLQYVDDGVAAGLYSNDIDDQAPGNYAYDKVGNLIEDKQAKMLIRWTDYGKVKEIDTLYQGNLSPNIQNSTPSVIYPRLKFKYDATGNRLEKEYVLHYKDIYLRDPQGNVMAVYRIRKDSLYLYEIPLYGSSRLGVIKENKLLMTKLTQNKNGVMSLPIPVNIAMSKNALKQSIYPLGKKHYETTDWLGNVRVTYTDKKSWQRMASLL